MTFQLDKKLKSDSVFITELKLCQIRLINNSDFPWLILIPQRANLIEITDLGDVDYELLNKEIMCVATALQNETSPDKLNIATIGNIVSQLHFHIVARYKNDKLFPKPVWGCKFTSYTAIALEERISALKDAIKI